MNSDWQNIIQKYMPEPSVELIKKEIIVPYNKLVGSAKLISEAFNYLIRIKIKHSKKDNFNKTDEYENYWRAGKRVEKFIKVNNDSNINSVIKEKYEYYLRYVNNEIIKNKNFLVTDKLLESVLYFGCLNHLNSKYDNWSALNFQTWEKLDKLKIELKKLVVNSLDFLEKKFDINNINSIKIKPLFKIQPKKLNVGLIDLVLDDVLINLKTTSKLVFDENDWYKFISHIVICKLNNVEINKIGIYFSRYDYFMSINLWDFFEKNNLSILVEELQKLENIKTKFNNKKILKEPETKMIPTSKNLKTWNNNTNNQYKKQNKINTDSKEKILEELAVKMFKASENLDFEAAKKIREVIFELKKIL